MTMDQVICIVEVSILLILDVDSEDLIWGLRVCHNSEFQSFLFWMLIRKWKRLRTYSGTIRVSILLILDVDSEDNWFWSVQIHHFAFQSFLFWMLIRKPYRHLCLIHLSFLFQSFLFWMLIRKFAPRLFPSQKARFQSFLFWMLIRKAYLYKRGIRWPAVSILLILDVDSEAD